MELQAIADEVYPGAKVVRTAKGYFDTNSVAAFITEAFGPYIATKALERALLVWDGCRTHTSAPVLDALHAANVRGICLPAHSSHLLQPMDVGFINFIKNKFAQDMRDNARNHQPTIEDAIRALLRSLRDKEGSVTCATAFQTAGLCPQRPEAIIAKGKPLKIQGPMFWYRGFEKVMLDGVELVMPGSGGENVVTLPGLPVPAWFTDCKCPRCIDPAVSSECVRALAIRKARKHMPLATAMRGKRAGRFYLGVDSSTPEFRKAAAANAAKREDESVSDESEDEDLELMEEYGAVRERAAQAEAAQLTEAQIARQQTTTRAGRHTMVPSKLCA